MIELAETCGFCAGSERAYNKVIETLEHNPGRKIVLFKRLLHNQDVDSSLGSKGVVRKDKKENFEPEDIIIIRAHGETKETFDYLESHGFTYIDCTCQKVKRIHGNILEKYNAGYIIIIIGDKCHAEVEGSNSICNNEGIIIGKLKDIEGGIGKSFGRKIFITAQTTCNREDFQEITILIKEKYKDHQIEIDENCLCDATGRMNESSAELAARCQTVMVIGDEGSANCQNLYAVCQKACPDTRLIKSRRSLYDDIINGKFEINARIGITGSASTPKHTIEECKQLLEFKMFYEDAAEKIRKKVNEYNNIFLKDNNPLFQGIIEQFVAIGSSEKAKMIRGCLIALGYKTIQAQNDSYEYSIDLAALYEFFETAILIHDDIFDKAPMRRNVTTVHEKIKNSYLGGYAHQYDLINFNALSLAVCAGDLGFYFLNQKIVDAYRKDSKLADILSYFNKIVITTIKGEMLDIALSLEERLNITHETSIKDNVLAIDTLKTAEYTTIGPFSLGMILGGADKADLEKYYELLKYLGIAFQIKDDWLNIYGLSEQGKPLCNDISEFKMTLFYSEVCKSKENKRELFKYYGKDNLSQEDINAVRNIFEKSDAKKEVEKAIEAYIGKCRTLLREIKYINEKDRDILYGFILFLELRSR
jgi:4-hydroxy-3-methylbut-2-enyl diphosphate reductase